MRTENYEKYIARLRRAVEQAIRSLRIPESSYYTVSAKINSVKKGDGSITVEGEYRVEGLFSVTEKGRFRMTFTSSMDELLEAEISPEKGY